MVRQTSILFILLALTVYAHAADIPNPGPRSALEPNILFEEGSHQLQENKFQEAAQTFQRFVDRYPLDPHFIDSNRYLGEAYLHSDQASLAIKPLLAFVKNHFHDNVGNSCRLELIETYLLLNQLSEARGMTEETLKQNPSSEMKQQALMYKALVLTQQNRLSDAKASLDAYEVILEKEHGKSSRPDLEAKVRFLLSTRECSSSKGPTTYTKSNEDEWLEYLQQLKTCFKASLAHDLTLVKKPEFTAWCKQLHEKEEKLKKTIHDKSFLPKIQLSLQEIKDFAKSKSEDLLRCDD